MTDETHVIEACHPCGIKVRILKEKAGTARCPRCKGLLGDPKLEQPCQGCGAVNRVLRSRLASARCGRCKEPLFQEGAIPRDLLVAESRALIDQIFADPRLCGRATRPRDLVEVVDILKAMPQRIAELAAAMAPGEDRDRLAGISTRCRALVDKLRPLAFEAPGVLLNDVFVERYVLGDAFEAMRHHPFGFEALKAIRKQDTGVSAARAELAPAGQLFERILNRLHTTDWDDMAADKARRTELAEKLFGELNKAIESWLLRPYKLEAMVKVAMTRVQELPGGAAAVEKHEALVREDVTTFLAITTVVAARGVEHHRVAGTLKEAWPALLRALRGAVAASA